MSIFGAILGAADAILAGRRSEKPAWIILSEGAGKVESSCTGCGGTGNKTVAEPFMLTVMPPVSSVRYRSTSCSQCKGRGRK